MQFIFSRKFIIAALALLCDSAAGLNMVSDGKGGLKIAGVGQSDETGAIQGTRARVQALAAMPMFQVPNSQDGSSAAISTSSINENGDDDDDDVSNREVNNDTDKEAEGSSKVDATAPKKKTKIFKPKRKVKLAANLRKNFCTDDKRERPEFPIDVDNFESATGKRADVHRLSPVDETGEYFFSEGSASENSDGSQNSDDGDDSHHSDNDFEANVQNFKTEFSSTLRRYVLQRNVHFGAPIDDTPIGYEGTTSRAYLNDFLDNEIAKQPKDFQRIEEIFREVASTLTLFESEQVRDQLYADKPHISASKTDRFIPDEVQVEIAAFVQAYSVAYNKLVRIVDDANAADTATFTENDKIIDLDATTKTAARENSPPLSLDQFQRMLDARGAVDLDRDFSDDRLAALRAEGRVGSESSTDSELPFVTVRLPVQPRISSDFLNEKIKTYLNGYADLLQRLRSYLKVIFLKMAESGVADFDEHTFLPHFDRSLADLRDYIALKSLIRPDHPPEKINLREEDFSSSGLSGVSSDDDFEVERKPSPVADHAQSPCSSPSETDETEHKRSPSPISAGAIDSTVSDTAASDFGAMDDIAERILLSNVCEELFRQEIQTLKKNFDSRKNAKSALQHPKLDYDFELQNPKFDFENYQFQNRFL